MDSTDQKILEILQKNNRMPAEKIADKVGLSPSAVQRRIKRLHRDGTIEADVAIVSPEMVDRKLTAIVEVTIGARPAERVLGDFRRLMLATPEVQQCYHVTGRGDFVLVVVAADMAEYEALTRKLFLDNPNVARFETSMVLKRVKFSHQIPFRSP